MSSKPQTTGKIYLKIARLVFIIGCGPLLLFILLDRLGFNVSDNPIGLGLLFVLAFPVSLILFGVGLVLGGIKPSSTTQSPNLSSDSSLASIKSQESVKPGLNPDQLKFIQDKSWGGCWGFIYFLYMNAPQAYFSHLPANLFYPVIIQNGRQQVWESGAWSDFDQFAQRNNQIDAWTKPIMIIGLSILALLFIF